MNAEKTNELRLVIRDTPTGREATPWLNPQREKFTRVTKEVAAEMKNTKLRGPARVRAFNARVSQRLREG